MSKTFSHVQASGNAWIDGLTDGYRWGHSSQAQPRQLTYKLHGNNEENRGFASSVKSFKSYAMLTEEQQAFTNSLKQIEDVCAIQFLEAKPKEQADLNFFITGRTLAFGHSGFAYTPNPKSKSKPGTVGMNINFHRDRDGNLVAPISLGGYYGLSFLHEISHAIGLKHPHDTGLNGQPKFPGISNNTLHHLEQGDFYLNSHPYTQMTYSLQIKGYKDLPRKRDFGYLKTLGSLDIAALQYIYGVNKTYNQGDNRYDLPRKNKTGTGWHVLWDTGGIDSIRAKQSRKPATINLRNANLKLAPSAGGFRSSVDGVAGGFVIPLDWDGDQLNARPSLCVIENAIGGRGNDSLIGNQTDNKLTGNQGDDFISGGSGNDTLIGGRGHDTLRGGQGADLFIIKHGDRDVILDFSFRQGDQLTLKTKERHIRINKNDIAITRSLKNGINNSGNTKHFLYEKNTNILHLVEQDGSKHPQAVAEIDLFLL